MLSIPRAASLTNLELRVNQCIHRQARAKTNLSNFHRVLCGAASVIFNVALLHDFVEPEIKEGKARQRLAQEEPMVS